MKRWGGLSPIKRFGLGAMSDAVESGQSDVRGGAARRTNVEVPEVRVHPASAIFERGSRCARHEWLAAPLGRHGRARPVRGEALAWAPYFPRSNPEKPRWPEMGVGRRDGPDRQQRPLPLGPGVRGASAGNRGIPQPDRVQTRCPPPRESPELGVTRSLGVGTDTTSSCRGIGGAVSSGAFQRTEADIDAPSGRN